MLGLDGIQWASFSRIGPRASVRSSRLTTIGLSRRFLAGSNAAADNYRIGNARRSFHGGLSRTRVRLPPPPPPTHQKTVEPRALLDRNADVVRARWLSHRHRAAAVMRDWMFSRTLLSNTMKSKPTTAEWYPRCRRPSSTSVTDIGRSGRHKQSEWNKFQASRLTALPFSI